MLILRNNLSKNTIENMVLEIGLLIVLIAPPVYISFKSVKSKIKNKKNKFNRIDTKYEFPEQLRI